MHPRTNSAQKPYAFSPFLERKRKEREKLYLPRVNYIIIGNPVVYIMALKTLKERKKKLYNTTFWSSGANCNEIQQSLNGGSKQSKRLVFVRKIHTLKGPYCCTQGAGNLSEFLRGIWWGLNGHLDKSPRVPGGGPRGKPLIDALLLQKTGNWPVHDIKSFAIPTFLSSLLLKEQMMISKKKICVREYEIAKQEGVLSKKSTGLKGNIYK